ncbi:MAG: tagaturonate reductase [Chitinophagaceae bacterium]
MILSNQILPAISAQSKTETPAENVLAFPEKILQFGTGVLLRGLPDYFVDKANKQGIFKGRIVVVKSTSQGGADAFATQDNLFTQCVRGIENGKSVDEAIVNASISRVLAASGQWNEILACAENPDLQIVISNTTEVGITLLDNDDVNANPPVSFPGKLLAFLLQRYKKFNGSKESGLVIIPTELITENGLKLKNIVLELARQNKLEQAFIDWVNTANDFCNSLVDRIVPGKLPPADQVAMEAKLGYKDELMIMSEVYRLWAIETSSVRSREILSFSEADAGVIIASDIDKFRELKLRLLNGSHTFTCALAVNMGFNTVKQAMADKTFFSFISQLMHEEIVPAIVDNKINAADANSFALQVQDRYKNPFIEHQWLSISLQYTSKMKMRNVPLLQQYYAKRATVPTHMAFGFAAYLLFMRSEKAGNAFEGNAGGKKYTINDDKAANLHDLWLSGNTDNFVSKVLADMALWGVDLNTLPGFGEAVSSAINSIQQLGIIKALEKVQAGHEI